MLEWFSTDFINTDEELFFVDFQNSKSLIIGLNTSLGKVSSAKVFNGRFNIKAPFFILNRDFMEHNPFENSQNTPCLLNKDIFTSSTIDFTKLISFYIKNEYKNRDVLFFRSNEEGSIVSGFSSDGKLVYHNNVSKLSNEEVQYLILGVSNIILDGPITVIIESSLDVFEGLNKAIAKYFGEVIHFNVSISEIAVGLDSEKIVEANIAFLQILIKYYLEK